MNENSHISTILPIITERSSIVMPWMFMGSTMPVIPIIMRMLNTFEPMTLPMAMAERPLRAATMLVASSGSDVPQATMVRPMTASLTPKALAVVFAPLTNNSLPPTRQTSPNSRKPTAFHTAIGFSSMTVSLPPLSPIRTV